MEPAKKILIVSSDDKLKDVLNFCFDGWGYEVFLHHSPKQISQAQEIEAIKKVSPDVIIIDVQSARKEQLDICRLLKNDLTTSFTPIITLINKRHLRNQLLNLKQGVDDYLIKPPDPLDLRLRIEIALRRSHHTIHASSLTGLPGGKILEEVLNEKVKTKDIFSFAYLDIDNFKSFNDVYGYQKGDRVLLQTAHMLFAALKQFGNNDDFIGHIGGDDFVFISTPDKYEKICTNFIDFFDRIVPFHYSSSDRNRGFVLARDRTRQMKKIPLMSISIAVVNRDSSTPFKNSIAINERIAEIKRYLKTIPGSKYMSDRRDSKLFSHSLPQVNKRSLAVSNYKPLGHILLESGLISYEQLDEGLMAHWRRGVLLGEMLKELGFLASADLEKAIIWQKNNEIKSSISERN